MRLYDRIYYTLYRILIGFGQVNEIDSPRSNVAILLTLFMGLNVVAALILLSSVTGSDIITGSMLQAVIIGAIVVTLNFCFIFCKKRYNRIENDLSITWNKDKHKNILLTVAYIIFTGIFMWFSFKYTRNH